VSQLTRRPRRTLKLIGYKLQQKGNHKEPIVRNSIFLHSSEILRKISCAISIQFGGGGLKYKKLSTSSTLANIKSTQ